MSSPENSNRELESYRQLVAGTAHDLNNLLLLVNGCAELVLDDESLRPQTRELMNAIVDAGGRARSLMQQRLSVGRAETSTPVVDLAALLRSAATLLARLAGDEVAVRLLVEEAPLWVLAETSQLEQIVVNLTLNARDAMPSGGVLTITAGPGRPAGVDTADAEGSRAAPRNIRLTVSDTGGGVDPRVRDRMFEPYVTTKAGAGSGLGLAVVRAVLEQLGGSIDVASDPGHGATFSIDLPQAPPPGADGA
ncbi:MAG: sensor histidine kinase [Vicinamibacterales bacterium]